MPKRNSIFNSVVKEKVPESFHNLSYANHGTCKGGQLVPILIKPVIPGDVWYGGSALMMRTQPMVSPLLTNINVEIRYFYVPYRMVWHNWVNYLPNQDPKKVYNGQNPFTGHFPRLDHSGLSNPLDGAKPGTLGDWLGLTPKAIANESNKPISALAHRSYWLIWNEYFRDQNIQRPITFHFDDTDEVISTGSQDLMTPDLLNVCWKKDRFTSALPFPQKGDDVDIMTLVNLVHPERAGVDPSEVIMDGPQVGQWYYDESQSKWVWLPAYNSNDQNVQIGATLGAYTKEGQTGNLRYNTAKGYQQITAGTQAQYISNPQLIDPNGTLSADISVRRIRQASALQRILEKKALAGSRYSEYVLSMYGVRIPDAELQRPVYLGGGSAPINVSPVEQTSNTNMTSPQGNLAGKGVSVGGFHLSRPWLLNDFGYIMGVMYVRPEAEYSQGLRRDLWMNDPADYYNPDYQLLGEDEILNGEVCYGENPTGTFGYQQRYAELKTSENEAHGNFKYVGSNNSMLSWVMGRYFDTQVEPALNEGFVRCAPQDSNNFAVSSQVADPYIFDIYHHLPVRRPMLYAPILRNGQI